MRGQPHVTASLRRNTETEFRFASAVATQSEIRDTTFAQNAEQGWWSRCNLDIGNAAYALGYSTEYQDCACAARWICFFKFPVIGRDELCKSESIAQASATIATLASGVFI